MATFKYQAVGDASWNGEFEVSEGSDPAALITKGIQFLKDQAQEHGVRPEQDNELFSIFATAMAQYYLTEDVVDLGEISVKSGGMILIELIPADKGHEPVKIPFPPDCPADSVIADIRDHFELGANVQISLYVLLQGRESPIAGSALVRDFPSKAVYWRARPYG